MWSRPKFLPKNLILVSFSSSGVLQITGHVSGVRPDFYRILCTCCKGACLKYALDFLQYDSLTNMQHITTPWRAEKIKLSLRIANHQVGPGDLPELPLISRLQRSVPLEGMSALECELQGPYASQRAFLSSLSPGSIPKSQPRVNSPTSLCRKDVWPFLRKGQPRIFCMSQ